MSEKRVILIRNANATDYGGGERFPIFLADSLKKCGITPVIVSRHQALLEFAASHQIRTVRSWWWSVQNWSGFRTIFVPLYLLWQIALYFHYIVVFISIRPSVVHIQSKDDFIAGTFAARTLGCRVIWTDHADLKHIWKNVAIWYKNPVGKIVYLAAYAAHQITVVSKSELYEVTRHLPARSGIKSRIIVVYNGCADVYDNYKKKLSSQSMKFVIASRLVTDKGIREAIEAFLRLHHEHPDTKLTIAGDGPDSREFKKLASGCSAIEFVGHQSDPYKVMTTANVFLQPTYHEGFSVVLVEAAMLGLAIIATDVGGNPEIIEDRKTGLLIPAKNTEALYCSMLQLYQNSSLRSTIAQGARDAYLKDFVFDDIVKNDYLPIYYP